MSRTKTELTEDKESTEGRPQKRRFLQDFWQFMSKHSVIGLAIGIVIGQTTRDTVNTLVTGIITPFLQLLIPHVELQNLTVNIGKAQFEVGLFLDSLLQLFIIMLILYIVIGKLLKRDDLLTSKTAPRATAIKKKAPTKKEG